MRLVLTVILSASACCAWAQNSQPPEIGPKPAAKADEKKKKAAPRPRVQLKRNGGNVGDDAAGGGARSAEPSRGGTPGTPSGSFTR